MTRRMYASGWLMHVVAMGAFAAAVNAQRAPGDPAPPYRPELERAYGLQKGQVLKHVPRPFIPERMEWYRAENKTQAEAIPAGPDYIAWQFDEKEGLRSWGMGFGFKKLPLRSVLETPLRMRTYEYEGPGDLLSLDMAGDWVVRPEADKGEQLAALARYVKQLHGRDVRFEQRELPREVIVASGTWKFTKLEGARDGQVRLFLDDQNKAEDGGGGGSGDLDEFLKMLGSRVGSAVISEVEGPKPGNFNWTHHNSSRLHNLPEGPDRMEKLVSLLDVVSKQTGLTFELARRKVPVWVLFEVKPEA